MKKYEKWDNYKVGQVSWINSRRQHPHRQIFVDFVVEHANSVLEIGPGEMIEYQKISKHKDIQYSIVDVSDTFISNCSSKFPDVKIYRMPMESITLGKVGKHDIVYVASVLEHSKNVSLAIQNLIQVSRRFHFVMFKWSYGGDLKSVYNKKKKYWSTSFNIHKLINEIGRYGKIERCVVAKQDGDIIDFGLFSVGKHGECRTGDYLVISGTSGT